MLFSPLRSVLSRSPLLLQLTHGSPLPLLDSGFRFLASSGSASVLRQSHIRCHQLLYSVTKGVKRRVSTMYFYITAYRQYAHSGSDTRIHNWLASGESILLLSSSAPDIHNGSRIQGQLPPQLTDAEPFFSSEECLLIDSLSPSLPLDWLQFL